MGKYMQFNVRNKTMDLFFGVSFSRFCLPALFSRPPSLSSLYPFHPLRRGLLPAFTQWTHPHPYQMTLHLFLPLPLPLPLLSQINSPQPPNSPMDCQFLSSHPGLSNSSACRHIRSRITVVCAEVCHRAILTSVSVVLKAK